MTPTDALKRPIGSTDNHPHERTRDPSLEAQYEGQKNTAEPPHFRNLTPRASHNQARASQGANHPGHHCLQSDGGTRFRHLQGTGGDHGQPQARKNGA